MSIKLLEKNKPVFNLLPSGEAHRTKNELLHPADLLFLSGVATQTLKSHLVVKHLFENGNLGLETQFPVKPTKTIERTFVILRSIKLLKVSFEQKTKEKEKNQF